MQKNFITISLFAFVLVCAGVGLAQSEKPFDAKELNKFIADYPDIARQMEKMGQSLDAKDDPTAWQNLTSAKSFAAVLEKKGWLPERFAYLISHVTTGLAGINMAEYQPVLKNQLSEAEKAIRDNPGLNDEMKEQLLSQLKQGMGAASQMSQSLDELPVQEVDLIQRNKEKLMGILRR